MERNVGRVDQIIRIVVGLVIIVLGIIFKSWLGLIGLLPLATGVFGRCGLYYPFKINTCRKSDHEAVKSAD